MKKFWLNFNRKLQYKAIGLFVVIGGISYFFDRYSGPGATVPGPDAPFFPLLVHRIAFISIIILFLLPIIGIVREKILVRYYMRHIDRNSKFKKLEDVCSLFNFDRDVMKNVGMPDIMQKSDIIKMIKKYLVD